MKPNEVTEVLLDELELSPNKKYSAKQVREMLGKVQASLDEVMSEETETEKKAARVAQHREQCVRAAFSLLATVRGNEPAPPGATYNMVRHAEQLADSLIEQMTESPKQG